MATVPEPSVPRSPLGSSPSTQDDHSPAYRRALEYLNSRLNYERAPMPSHSPRQHGPVKLARMRRLLELLGNPQLSLPTIHVAGTKGKGSTCWLIAQALAAAGYRTGLYTSPHFQRLEERYCLNGQPCSPERLTALVDAVGQPVETLDAQGSPPTFFEIATALAWMHFADQLPGQTPNQPADCVVMEVGLGGRLDSTNVCAPCVSVITSISFDHMAQLGTTLAEIAREKAGIIKSGVPVISGVTDPEPAGVIDEVAKHRQAPVIQSGLHFEGAVRSDGSPPRELRPPGANPGKPPLIGKHGGQLVDFRWRGADDDPEVQAPASNWRCWENVELALLGRSQAANAAVAWATLGQLQLAGFSLNEACVRDAFAGTQLSGRFEQIPGNPTTIVDIAHNGASMAALVQTLQARFPTQRKVAVFSTSRDKDLPGMLMELPAGFDAVVVTQFQSNPRALPVAAILQAMRDHWPEEATAPQVHFHDQPQQAWQLARRLAGTQGLLCITGSTFLVAELRPLLISSST